MPMAHSKNFRPNWLVILATSATILTLPTLLGWRQGWIASVCLAALVLAAWVLDPLTLAITLVALSLACSVAPQTIDPLWVPKPVMLWFAIAFIHLVRIELKVRENLFRKDAALQAERDEQQEWRTFFDNSPAAILTADGEGRIIMGNPAAGKLLGCEDRPLKGHGLAPTLTALGAALRIKRKDTLLHTLTGCTGWRPNGEMFVADAWFSINETASGTRLGAVVVDASERLQERARGGLRSSMSTSQIAMGALLHEIRNMSGAAALMYSNLARAEVAHLAELQKNADFEALGGLLKALTNLAATELRPGEGSLGGVDLTAMLAQFRIIIGPWFLESEMRVKWDIASDLPHVFGEESGLLQNFLNLAQNSNKAMLSSEQGQLTIQARVEGEWVVVRFRDTGPGIANPDELFEPFRRSTGVKGLGLFVSRAIAHSFYGELKYAPVESGSCFEVELLPLLELKRVAVEYESATIEH
jgi:two-component system sensor kinase FixL